MVTPCRLPASGLAGGSSAAAAGTAGISIVKRVPSPGTESMPIEPPLRSTIPYTTESPRPVPTPSVLGREEGIERVRGHVGRHPFAAVLDDQPHALAVRGLGADRQRASVGHRIARVERQVEEDLLDPPAAQSNRRQLRGRLQPQLDALSGGAPQEPLAALDRSTDVACVVVLPRRG